MLLTLSIFKWKYNAIINLFFFSNVNSFLQHEAAGKPLYLCNLNLKGNFC